jgi:hypothetical protein
VAEGSCEQETILPFWRGWGDPSWQEEIEAAFHLSRLRAFPKRFGAIGVPSRR